MAQSPEVEQQVHQDSEEGVEGKEEEKKRVRVVGVGQETEEAN